MPSPGLGSEPGNLQLHVDSISALIRTGLPSGNLNHLNRAWLTYVDLMQEDLSGWRRTAAIHPEDVAATMEKWRAAQVSVLHCPAKVRMLNEE